MIMNQGNSTWERLGRLLIQRRTALDPRYNNRQAFATATGLKYRLVYDIEEARRDNFGDTTLTSIEVAYKLDPGAIRRFLDGGELEPGTAAAPAAIPRDDSGVYAEADEAASILYAPLIQRRLDDLRKDGDPRPTGEAMFLEDGDALGAGPDVAAGLANAWSLAMDRGLDLDRAVRYAARAWVLNSAYRARQAARSTGQNGALVRM